MINGPRPLSLAAGLALAVGVGDATATGAVVAGAVVAGGVVAGAVVATVGWGVGATVGADVDGAVGTGVGCGVRTVGTGVGATVGGGDGVAAATTMTVPLMNDGWNVQMYVKVPATEKVMVFVPPGAIGAVSNEPPSAFALCCKVS